MRWPSVDCERCGKAHVKCLGHRKRRDADGALVPCSGPPTKASGEKRQCRMHDGLSPSQRGEREATAEVERQARRALRDITPEPILDPVETLSEMAGRAKQWLDHLGDLVEELGSDYRFRDDKGGEQLRAQVALYERAMDRTQKFVGDIVKLNLDERRVALDEARLDVVERLCRSMAEGLFGLLAGDLSAERVGELRAGLPAVWQKAIETTSKETRA